MPRPVFLLIPLSLLAASLAPASGETRDAQWQVCSGKTDSATPHRRIAACSALTVARDLSPADRARAYDHRGFAHTTEGRYDRAIEDFSTAIGLDPKFAQAYRNRGLAHVYRGENIAAIADYDRAIAIDPKYVDAIVNRGVAYQKLGRLDRAIADFDRAIAIDPAYTRAFANRCTTRYQRRDFDAAIADCTRAIALDKNQPVAFTNRALAYAAKLDYARALADYDAALAADPQNVNALKNRGCAYFYVGRFAESGKDFAAAFANDDTDIYPLVFAYVAAARAGKADAGTLGRAVAVEGGVAGNPWRKMLANFYLGRTNAAALLAEAAKLQDAANAKRSHARIPAKQVCEAQFHIGQKALLADDKGAAEAALKQAAANCPRHFVEWHAANADLGRLK